MKTVKRLVLFCTFCSVLLSVSHAQKPQAISRCATVDLGPAHLPRAPKDMTPWLDRYLKPGMSALGATSYRTIPVAFHVIYRTDGTGNISDTEINAQLNVLNSSFASSRYQFSLDRITRTQNNAWYDNMRLGSTNETNMKNTLAVNPATTLNFYITRPRDQNGNPVLGFASFPWDYTESSKMHGVVVQNASLPQGMFEDSRYDDGDTGTHEVGHFMGLYHTFQGLSCSGAGDYVDDTPFHNRPNYDCNYYDTCPTQWGSDPIYNFMNYTPDPCMYQFTTGQRARIDWAMATYKPSMSALYVTLIGDTYLPTGMTGYWTASVTGGNGTYNYKWYYRPISGSYTLVRDVTLSDRSDSYSRSAATEDFYIRVDVTSGSEFDSDEIFVDVCADPNCPLGPVFAIQADENTKVTTVSKTVPQRYALAQNYPNPFNPQTEIRFTLPEAAHVSIVVYDALGREVARLVDGTLHAGYHGITFDGTNLPSGLYLYRIEAANYTEIKSMLLIK